MTMALPPDVQSRIQDLVDSGRFSSAADVVAHAISALEREQAEIAAIQEGLDDVAAGRVRPLTEVDAEIREQFGFAPRK